MTSVDHTAWDNTPVGGGQVLMKNASDFTLKNLGMHKIFTTANGKVFYDHSLKTSADLHFSSLPRSTRTLTSGTIDVYHNLLKYKASFAVTSPLSFSADCCYPVAGQLNVTLSGLFAGTATVGFHSSCGSASVNFEGVETAFTLALCE